MAQTCPLVNTDEFFGLKLDLVLGVDHLKDGLEEHHGR